MTKTVTISDELAAAVEEHRRAEGEATFDAAAETLIARGLSAEIDDMPGWTVDELRAAIEEGRKGPATPWNAAEVRAEVLRRYAARKAR
ncbi:MAG: hypothetical protein JSS00_05300 [Proteobacteria bacterium]|nr:hypothetical protein [Pseudomonadota bacterium]